ERKRWGPVCVLCHQRAGTHACSAHAVGPLVFELGRLWERQDRTGRASDAGDLMAGRVAEGECVVAHRPQTDSGFLASLFDLLYVAITRCSPTPAPPLSS